MSAGGIAELQRDYEEKKRGFRSVNARKNSAEDRHIGGIFLAVLIPIHVLLVYLIIYFIADYDIIGNAFKYLNGIVKQKKRINHMNGLRDVFINIVLLGGVAGSMYGGITMHKENNKNKQRVLKDKANIAYIEMEDAKLKLEQAQAEES